MATAADHHKTSHTIPGDDGIAGSSPNAASAAGMISGCFAQHRQLQYEVSRYIELLLGELGTMANAADLKHLLYFIDMTRQEASNQTRRCQPDR